MDEFYVKWKTVQDDRPREHSEPEAAFEAIPLPSPSADFAAYVAQVTDSIIRSFGVPSAIWLPSLKLAEMAFERSLESLGKYHRLGIYRFSVGGVTRAMVRAGRWSAD